MPTRREFATFSSPRACWLWIEPSAGRGFRDRFDRPRSGPKLFAREPCSVAHRLELCPYHGRVDLGAIGGLRRETAVRACHDAFPADQPGKADQALGDQLGVLDDVACMCDNAWD